MNNYEISNEGRGMQRRAARTGGLWQAVVELHHDAASRLAGDADVKEHVHHGCALEPVAELDANM